MRALATAFGRQPPAVRAAAAIAAIVALGAAVLSWDALRWGAGELGVDPYLTPLFPVVVDGVIAAGTVAVLVVKVWRTRAYVWVLLFAGIAASVTGNAAHARAGGALLGPFTLHQLGAAVPALALAATLHLLVIIVRVSSAPPAARRGAPRARRARTAAARLPALLEGAGAALSTRELAERLRVSPGHVRKIRARGAPAPAATASERSQPQPETSTAGSVTAAPVGSVTAAPRGLSVERPAAGVRKLRAQRGVP
jgi:hypothetical protein